MIDTIRTDGLTKKFAAMAAVRELDFSVKAGKIFGLIGPNGAGKTTTTRLLTGILKPTAGDAWLCGKSVRSDMAGIRKLVGLVPEGVPLFRRLTARETISFFGRVFGVPEPMLSAKTAVVAENLGLSDDLDRMNEGLSLGTKKKVLFACALVHEPKVLICDEPTLGLDPRATRTITRMLGDLREEGKTILLTSHNMVMVDELCDDIAVIYKGNICVRGAPGELKSEVSRLLDQKEVNLDEVFLHYTA